MPIEQLLDAANRPLTDPDLNRMIGAGQPRFELYHFALSVCSQKVRACLAEKRADYFSRDINVQPGNYHPDYVRLRLAGRGDRSLVGGYTGRSAASSEGFDPAVVPTLVDLAEKSVVVDSAAICAHIDTAVEPVGSLTPLALRSAVEQEIAIVDATPHVAILYGAHPDGDFRPERIRKSMSGIHDRKIAKLEAALEQVTGDAELTEAFEAKIAKEAAAREFVATPQMMRDAVNEMIAIVAALDERLSDGRSWICGESFTLADILWAVSLFRMQWIGMAFCWMGNHRLNLIMRTHASAYAVRLFSRPSFREAVIDWPGMPRTEYVSGFYDP